MFACNAVEDKFSSLMLVALALLVLSSTELTATLFLSTSVHRLSALSGTAILVSVTQAMWSSACNAVVKDSQ